MDRNRYLKKLLTLAVIMATMGGTAQIYAITNKGYVQDSSGTLTVTNADKTVSASSSDPGDGAYAYGFQASGSGAVINTAGSVNVSTKAENTAGGTYHAYSVGAFNGGEVDINAAGGQVVKLEGDVTARNGTVTINLDQPGAYLKAGNFGENFETPVLTLSNGGAFYPDFNYTYSNQWLGGSINGTINLNNGGVIDLTWDNPTRDVSDANNARTLILKKLNGGGGTIIINTNVKGSSGYGDKVFVTDSDGGSVILKVGYDPIFQTLKRGQSYTSNITQEGLADNSGKLSVKAGVTEYNAQNFQPIIDSDTSIKFWGIKGFKALKTIGGSRANENVKMVADNRFALRSLWFGETNNMQKRMGDLRSAKSADAGIWARYAHNKLESSGDRDADLTYNYFQVGYDKDKTVHNGRMYRGFAVSYAKGSVDYERGDGDVKETTLSLYQTWIGNNGHYYDIILKGGKFINKYNVTTAAGIYSDADYHTWAYSISGEYGVRKPLSHGMYWEPQIELILGHMNSADYTTSTGMESSTKATNMAITRVGAAIGKEMNSGSIYGRASYFHDFGSGVNIVADDATYDRDAAKNWCEIAIGGSVNTGSNCQIYGELGKYFGQLKNNVQINLGARWKI